MNADWLNAVATAAAAAGALAFFLWKFTRGYHHVNLSLSVEMNRNALHADDDCLAITLRLDKGDNGSMSLHDVAARVSWDEEVRILSFTGTQRLSYRSMPTDSAVAVRWDKRSAAAPFLNLSPGDETEFSCYAKVPRRAICAIEVVVLGTKLGTQWKCQWRASRVSSPNSTQEPTL